MPARMRVLVATIALLAVIFLSMPSAHAQLRKLENVFSLSPADFTIRDAPPLGEPYLLESKLVIRNGDTIKRNFILSVRAPSRENLKPGYEPIPDVNWFILIPAVIEIEENSSDMIEMALNIPRWENLTDQRWEAWISVTRMAEPGEILQIEYISKAYIETTKELPPPPSPSNDLLLPFTVIIILVVGVVGTAFLLARHRRGEKEPAFLRVLLTRGIHPRG